MGEPEPFDKEGAPGSTLAMRIRTTSSAAPRSVFVALPQDGCPLDRCSTLVYRPCDPQADGVGF